jgi:hypothetical protein
MTFPPPAPAALKLQIPAFVTKLPPVPAIKIEPSGDIVIA